MRYYGTIQTHKDRHSVSEWDTRDKQTHKDRHSVSEWDTRDIQTHKERHSVYLSEILGDTQGFRHFVFMSLRKLLLNMQTHIDRHSEYMRDKSVL